MSEIQNIIDDLYNGESIVEDDQKLIKSALKLQELINERIKESITDDDYTANQILYLLIEESEK